MALSVSIIGSFKKKEIYSEVCEYVRVFQNNGIAVNSPRGSKVTDSVDEFVIFETDDSKMTPADIQMVTLDKILKSDVVLVCDPKGYVGRTTCYEIGFCMSRKVPLYFTERPVDLPIAVSDSQIVSKEEILDIILQSKEQVFYNSDCEVAKKAISTIWSFNSQVLEPVSKRIVVCGSMQFWREMLACQMTLQAMGIDAIIPKDEASLPENMSEEDFRKFKKRVSGAYLKKIREKETSAVLVYNETKRGVDNYIGANTFVELAMAFSWNRRIFLLNDIYEPYKDELSAWDVICLHGDVGKIQDYMKTENQKTGATGDQINFFDALGGVIKDGRK